jgi:hypothetical protein
MVAVLRALDGGGKKKPRGGGVAWVKNETAVGDANASDFRFADKAHGVGPDLRAGRGSQALLAIETPDGPLGDRALPSEV